MKFKYCLSEDLKKKCAALTEFRNGGTQVKVKLRSGDVFKNVLISNSSYIVAVKGFDKLPFDVDEIEEIYQSDEDKRPPEVSGWIFFDDWQ